jgi:hypothetical protein
MSIEPTAPLAAGRSVGAPDPPRAAAAPARPAAPADRVELSGGIPDAPPPEVLEQMSVAAQVAQELHDSGRRLRFTPDPAGARVVVAVEDLDGNVLRTIPPSDALGIASGELEA